MQPTSGVVGDHRRGDDAGLGVLAGRLGRFFQQLRQGLGGVFGDDQPLWARPWFLLLRLRCLSHCDYVTLEKRVILGEKKSAPDGVLTRKAAAAATRLQTGRVCLFHHRGMKVLGVGAGGRQPQPAPTSSGSPSATLNLFSQLTPLSALPNLSVGPKRSEHALEQHAGGFVQVGRVLNVSPGDAGDRQPLEPGWDFGGGFGVCRWLPTGLDFGLCLAPPHSSSHWFEVVSW